MESYLAIWRCSKCGKWSHAKVKPKFHQAFSITEPEDKSLVIEYSPGAYDHLNGTVVDGGWIIKCGPFDKWWAVKALVQ